jgi:uncharacterized protein (DUF58 family)
MFFGTRNKLKSVTAAELAALGAWRAFGVGDRVGAVVFGDTDHVDIRPQRSQATIMSLLGSVLKMNHELHANSQVTPNPDMLNQALASARKLVTHNGLVVIISDFFGVDEQTERLSAQLAEHNDVLALLVHDPIRLQPATRSLAVSDGSLQMSIDFSDRQVREKIAVDFGQEQEQIKRFLTNLAAPTFMINNEGDVVDQIRRLLGVPVRGG